MKEETTASRILKIVTIVIAITAIGELGLAQFHVRMARLSAVETTGISLFSFIIFGLVTLFAASRMNNSLQGQLFAAAMSIVSALCATWYVRLLFGDEMFFRNLHYVMDRHTREFERLPLSALIRASIPLACVILGAVIYYASAAAILLASFLPRGRKGA